MTSRGEQTKPGHCPGSDSALWPSVCNHLSNSSSVVDSMVENHLSHCWLYSFFSIFIFFLDFHRFPQILLLSLQDTHPSSSRRPCVCQYSRFTAKSNLWSIWAFILLVNFFMDAINWAYCFSFLVYRHIIFSGIHTSAIFWRYHINVFSIWMGVTTLTT